MRHDMYEIIIERPRHGHAYPAQGLRRRRRARGDVDDLPRHEGLKKPFAHKQLNENLAPLRRYLERNVGRPWSRVYADLCCSIDVGSAIQKHVRDHVEDFVVLHVFERHGVLWAHRRWQIAPLTELRYDRLYVDPRTGLLAKLRDPRPSRVERIARGGRTYARVDGVWCEVELAPITPSDHGWYDVVLRQTVGLRWTKHATRDAWGRDDVYAKSVRPLTRRERVVVTQGGPARVR